MMKSRKGLTLIEVLVVIMILGVLAGIVLPRFFGQTERGSIPEAVETLSAIRQGEEAYRMEYGAYYAPGNWDPLGMDTPNNTRWTYAVAINALTYTVTATRNAACGTQCCPGRTITLTNTGVYGGTHPWGPNPAAGSTCT